MLRCILAQHKSSSTLFILVHKDFEFIKTSDWRFDSFPKGQQKCNRCNASLSSTQLAYIIFRFTTKSIKLKKTVFGHISTLVNYSPYSGLVQSQLTMHWLGMEQLTYQFVLHPSQYLFDPRNCLCDKPE